MAVYAYRCPVGGEEATAVAPFGRAPKTVHCPEHQADCYRLFTTAAGIMHKLRNGYLIMPGTEENRKAREAYIKQEERRGHDVKGRRA